MDVVVAQVWFGTSDGYAMLLRQEGGVSNIGAEWNVHNYSTRLLSGSSTVQYACSSTYLSSVPGSCILAGLVPVSSVAEGSRF